MANTVYIYENDITRLLDRVIHPDVHNRDQIVEYFTHLIRDRYTEASMFTRVILDIVPKPIYSIGDTIYVHRDRVYVGTYDFEKTNQAGFILDKDDNYIKAKITAVNKFIENCYTIDIDRVQSDDKIDVYRTTSNHEYIYHEKIVPAADRLNVGDII